MSEVRGLSGERVRLVPSEASLHLENALRWLNDPEVTAKIAVVRGATRREEEQFFEHVATNRDSVLHWAIVVENLGHIGFIALHDINWPLRSATGGLMIGDRRAWGRGFATDAVRVRSRFAFDQLGLHRLDGHTVNPAMARVYEKAGYRKEGTARQKLWRDGARHDVQLYGLLASDLDTA